MSAGVPFLVAVPFTVAFVDRPLRADGASSGAPPTVYDVERFASLPEALVVEPLTSGLDAMRLGVSSFLLFDERGESSIMMWWMLLKHFGVCVNHGECIAACGVS